MMKWKRLAMAVAVVLTGCVSQKPAEKQSASLTILHQSNRSGAFTPCGCHANPNGGMEREYTAVNLVRESGRGVFYVDAGNTFVPLQRKAKVTHYANQAPAIVEMLNLSGLDVLAPGPQDYEMGVDTLINLAAKAKFPFLSTNIQDKDGKSLFQRYVILERQGVKVAFISLTPGEKISDPRVKVTEPVAAAQAVIQELKGQVGMIVALSQMGSEKDEALSQNFGAQIIVGADIVASGHRTYRGTSAQTVVMDTGTDGQMLGRMDLELQTPFQGLYSPFSIQLDQKELASLEKSKAKANPKKAEAVQREIDTFKKYAQLDVIPGGTRYEHMLIELGESFKGKNPVSEVIAAEAKRLKQKAAAE